MKLGKVVTALGLTVLIAAGCTYNDFDREGTVVEGKETELKLQFAVAQQQLFSRNESPMYDEFKVHNIYLLVFNNDGSRDFGELFDYDDIRDKTEQQNDGTGTTTGKVEFKATSGTDKRIYALANINSSIMSTTRDDLDAITSEAELKNYTASLSQQTVGRGSRFMLYGRGESLKGGQIDFPYQPSATILSGVVLKFRHLEAKITFNISTPEGVTFKAQSWRVSKVSMNVKPFNTQFEDNDESHYFQTEWLQFEGSGDKLNRTFTFYTLPNQRIPSAVYILQNKNPRLE